MDAPSVTVLEAPLLDAPVHNEGSEVGQAYRKYAAMHLRELLPSSCAFSVDMEPGALTSLMSALAPGYISLDTALEELSAPGDLQDSLVVVGEHAERLERLQDMMFAKVVAGGISANIAKTGAGALRLTASQLGITVHKVLEINTVDKFVKIGQAPVTCGRCPSAEGQPLMFCLDTLPLRVLRSLKLWSIAPEA